MVMSVVWAVTMGAAVVVVGAGGAATTTAEAAVMRGIAVKLGVDGAAGFMIEMGPAKATEARAKGKVMKRPRILVVVWLGGSGLGLVWEWCGKLL